MAKRFQVRRHTDKDGEHSSQDGLDRFQQEPSLVAEPATVTDVFCGSDMGRTAETVLAACCAHGIKAKVHIPDARFGNAEMFSSWMKQGFKDAVKETGSNLAAVKKILGDGYGEFQQSCLAAIKEAFNKIQEGGHGLTYIHSPTVEAIAEACGRNMDNMQLDSCKGMILKQDEDGAIRVVTLFL